jgi:hypothetical protein
MKEDGGLERFPVATIYGQFQKQVEAIQKISDQGAIKMAKLKGVIFGVENVLAKVGEMGPHAATLRETGRLVQFLKSKGVESVVMTNKDWGVTNRETNARRPMQDVVEDEWGVKLKWFQCAKDGVPAKQTDESIKYVRDKMGWEANETLFVGNTDIDLQASVNGKILLLNAEWYEKNIEYGFGFENPKEVARFIDTFCFRDHLWYFKIEEPSLRVYSLAPLGTFVDELKYYSNDFLANFKNELGRDEDFWTKFLCTSMYFSGIYKDVDYITAYPKHDKGNYQEVLVKPMTTFAKCFRKNYIPDLLVRHTTAIKSRSNRSTVNHENQLNTVCLNAKPHRIVNNAPKEYIKFPAKNGKTVLVIDDVCTKGMSFEAARVLLINTEAIVVCVSFLKALKHDYEALAPVTLANGPFEKNSVGKVQMAKTFDWRGHIVDKDAPAELTERLKRYQNWNWPDSI